MNMIQTEVTQPKCYKKSFMVWNRNTDKLCELTLGHLRYLLTDVPPQSNSPPGISGEGKCGGKISSLHSRPADGSPRVNGDGGKMRWEITFAAFPSR